MIQQAVNASLNVVGDNSATQFVFDLQDVYGLNFQVTAETSLPNSENPFYLINKAAIPDAVSVTYALGAVTSGVTVAISKRQITLSFTAAFTGEATIGLAFLFNG